MEPEVHLDNRGFFMETFKKNCFEKNIFNNINFCQDNRVSSFYMVLRGLHFQKEPFSQSKLISVNRGRILDIVVDIRKSSPTFAHWIGEILSSKTWVNPKTNKYKNIKYFLKLMYIML